MKVDLDLLADHLGGALDGTAEGARVAELVATDPEWARAAARLSGAFDAVAADLAAMPAPDLPDEVAARLDRALQTAGGPTTSRRGGRTGGGRRRGAPSTITASHDGQAGPPADAATAARRPPRATRRRRRAAGWGAGLAVAAAAAGFAAVNLNGLSGNDAGSVPTAAEDSATGGSADPPTLIASGEDYQRLGLPGEPPAGESLDQGPRPLHDGSGPDASSPNGPQITAQERGGDAAGVPAALRHLVPLPDSCLNAVRSGYAPEAADVDGVDYAHFEGAPSLVIWITTESGEQWVTVTGPRCGDAGSADQRHQVAVR